MFQITVIIPTFNSQETIADTLDSIKKQSFKGKIEIICIDDCSKDETVEVIKTYRQKNNLQIKILEQPTNLRQGAARNRGLKEAHGEYVFFLDSDDFIDENTFEVLYHKAKSTNDCDFVLCDWTYYYEDKGEIYVNNDLFLFDEWLEEENCEKLFQAESYFTVNKLYNKSFLIENEITFGEGYIYEDLEFYIATIQNANKIGIISNPFYKVRVNQSSTTKSNYNTTVHMDDYLTSISKTLQIFAPRHNESFYMVYKYLFGRALLYSEKRVPKKYKKTMIAETVKILNKRNTNYFVPKNIVLFNKLFFQKGLIQNNKIRTIMLIRKLQNKRKLDKYYYRYKKTKALMTKIFLIDKLKESKLNKKRRIRNINKIKLKYKQAPIKENHILFLGFDYRYVGNSKYLFEYLTKNYCDLKINFVTEYEAVPYENKIKPRSLDFWKALGEAKIVIIESWVPLAFQKKPDQVWIQLWHGTPYKKLFFDSHEKYISKYNRNHKRNKKKDIEKWDYLLADSYGAKDKFKTAFSIPDERIKCFGYPRVQWLKENEDNDSLKQKIKQDLNIPSEKKIIFYAPTWRDYNYKNDRPSFQYLLNLEKLANTLSDEYVFVVKLHNIERKGIHVDNVIFPSNKFETQELLLIADVLISDYSSIIFDALPIDLNFYLFINDREKYNEARGSYDDLDALLEPFTYNDEDKLLGQIIIKTDNTQHLNYKRLKEQYSNNFSFNSDQQLAEMIIGHMKA